MVQYILHRISSNNFHINKHLQYLNIYIYLLIIQKCQKNNCRPGFYLYETVRLILENNMRNIPLFYGKDHANPCFLMARTRDMPYGLTE